MSFIDQKCTFDVLSEDVLSECLPFTCGEDEDMDEFLSEENKTGCRLAIVDAKNKPKVLNFYEKNGFRYLFNREIDEDLYVKPPKNEEERKTRIQNPRTLATRLMYCDLLSD